MRVYPGADGHFTLYDDDGKTYAYEKGAFGVTHLHWDDKGEKLIHDGRAAWTVPDSEILEVVGR